MISETVFIDFDGVIADTYSICFNILHQIQPNLSEYDFKQKLERNINEELSNLQDSLQIDFWENYSEQVLDQPLVQDIEEAIEKISLSHPLIVVSSSPAEDITRYLEKYQLANYFTEVLGSESASRKKEVFEVLIKKYSIPPKESVFITDTLGDILEAHQANIQPIAVTWGFHEEDTLRKGNPTAIIDTPEQLSGAIEEAFDFSEEYD